MTDDERRQTGSGSPSESALFDSAPCGYVVTDDDGVIVLANAEFLRIIGREAKDVVALRTLASVVTVGGRVFFETHLMPMLQHDGVVREVELDVVRADGHRTPVLFNANPAGPSGSRAIRGVMIEALHRHKYEDDLRQATRAAKSAMEQAAATAETLQQTLIPPAPPQIPGLEIAAAYRPAGAGREVGGDFYDVFQVAPSSWCIAIGDVSGKGIPAATVTSLIRYTIRSLAIEHPDPADLLEHLDRTLRDHPTDDYSTLIIVRLDREGSRWNLQMSLAGHPQPLILRDDDWAVEFGTPGTPVGLIDDPEFHTVRLSLDRETVVMYTDGVTDARSPEGFFGVERLKDLVTSTGHDPRAITDAVAEVAVVYQQGDAADDIAVVTFSASSPTPPS